MPTPGGELCHITVGNELLTLAEDNLLTFKPVCPNRRSLIELLAMLNRGRNPFTPYAPHGTEPDGAFLLALGH